MGNRYKREINMNSKNKRWLEPRWDMNQPARLRHIHRNKIQKQQASFCCYAYHKGDSGRCDKLVFTGFDPILSSVQAQHWADENWTLYDHIDVLDSSGHKIYGR